MSSNKVIGKVTSKNTSAVDESEKDIIGELEDDEHKKAIARNLHAAAADQEKLTELKESYAGAILFFMWMWCFAVAFAVLTYFTYQINLGKEIPKEVIISIFTCTAVVIGLVGYILKGLFGSK